MKDKCVSDERGCQLLGWGVSQMNGSREKGKAWQNVDL